MANELSDEALDKIFREARTHNGFSDTPVDDDLLRKIYDVMKWGPTSANCQPQRILFLKSKEAKERLRPALYLQSLILRLPCLLIPWPVGWHCRLEKTNPLWILAVVLDFQEFR